MQRSRNAGLIALLAVAAIGAAILGFRLGARTHNTQRPAPAENRAMPSPVTAPAANPAERPAAAPVESQKPAKEIGPKAVLKLYFNAYLRGDTAHMDELAADGVAFSQLIARGFPKRLHNYLILVPDILSMEDRSPEMPKDAWYINANDLDGLTREFAAVVRDGRITDLRLLGTAGDRVAEGRGIPLTRADRLNIIDACIINGSRGSLYVDFACSENFKGYTQASPGYESGGVGAVHFWHKVSGDWQVVMAVQDSVPRIELDKLGVPRDVQQEIWGEEGVYVDNENE